MSDKYLFGVESLNHEQPRKSISLGVIGAPGAALSGFPRLSWVFVIDGVVQSAVPPLNGTNASALMEKGTLPVAGVEKVTVPVEKVATLGLLAGSMSVYCAQFVFAGALTGQLVFAAMLRFATELPSAGIVTGRDPLLSVTVWIAETRASIVAGVAGDVPEVAVTNPWNVAGPSRLPVSANNNMLPTFVPPGTPASTVAL